MVNKMNKKDRVNKNPIVAKIILTILIIFASLLSLYKFSLYLTENQVTYFKNVETIFNDFNNTLKELNDIELINLITNNDTEINSDIKINSSNLVGDLTGLENKINSLTYSHNLRLDKKNNYLSSKFKMLDATEKMHIDYMNSDGHDYLKSSNTDPDYIEITNYPLNFYSLDAENQIELNNILKTELLKLLNNRNIEIIEEAIAVNNKTVDCEKMTFGIDEKDLTIFIDNVVSKAQNNKEINDYLANILRTNRRNLSHKIKELKNDLEIESSSKFKISIYINNKSKEGVKLEISHFKNNNSLLKVSYTKDYSYHKIETINKGNANSITLMGTMKNKYILTIINDNHTILLTASNREDSREGLLRVNSNQTREAIFNAKFEYLLTKTDIPKLSTKIDADIYDNSETGKLNIEIDSIFNNNVDIKPIVISNFKSLELFEIEIYDTLQNSLLHYFKNIDLNSPLNNLPTTFTD